MFPSMLWGAAIGNAIAARARMNDLVDDLERERQKNKVRISDASISSPKYWSHQGESQCMCPVYDDKGEVIALFTELKDAIAFCEKTNRPVPKCEYHFINFDV